MKRINNETMHLRVIILVAGALNVRCRGNKESCGPKYGVAVNFNTRHSKYYQETMLGKLIRESACTNSFLFA